jgi:lysophospholipase L1-like esterase
MRIYLFAVVCLIATSLHAQVKQKYSFGPSDVPGFTHVKPDDNYTIERGFGFDLGTKVTITDRGIASNGGKPILFSTKLAPGAYQVNVTLGDTKSEGITTVKSETRRLMLEKIHTKAGEFVTKSFLVHIRVPDYPGGTVSLKEREKLPILYVQWSNDTPLISFLELDWDEKLTLEFSETPAVSSVEITDAPQHTTIYLVGDSTMTDQMMEPIAAWGQMFPRWFKAPVVIANYAECGESAASFFSEKRWPKLMSEIHAGDYVLVQFGINDRGLAEEQIRRYFGQYIKDTKDKGANPVIVTSQNLQRGTLGPYQDVLRTIAKEQNVPLIDLNAMSVTLFKALGDDLPKAFYRDGTHHTDYGAYLFAKCVVQGAIDAKLPWAQCVTEDWKTFDPAQPDKFEDFHMQQDPQLDPARPGGPGTPDGRGAMAASLPAARGRGPASQPAQR